MRFYHRFIAWCSAAAGVLRTKMVPASAIKQIQRDGDFLGDSFGTWLSVVERAAVSVCIKTRLCRDGSFLHADTGAGFAPAATHMDFGSLAALSPHSLYLLILY